MRIIKNTENKQTLKEIMSFDDFFNSRNDIYFQINEWQYLMRMYSPDYYGSANLYLTDITDGGKIGKECKKFLISGSLNDLKAIYENNFDDMFVKIVENDLENLKSEAYKTDSKRVFNPFTIKENYKPLKEKPSKWTLKHALRALVNNQYKNFKCDGQYSDDYAWDNANNYGKGEIKDVNYFIEKIINEPSGWKAREWDNNNLINVDCHSFNLNSFELVL